jgi:hypothetical protein
VANIRGQALILSACAEFIAGALDCVPKKKIKNGVAFIPKQKSDLCRRLRVSTHG